MKKLLVLLLTILMVMSMTGCNDKQETTNKETNHEVVNLYENNSFVVGLEYNGLDFDGLTSMNTFYGGDGYGSANVNGGCSITFAKYFDGTVGAVRNMDLQASNYCAYELFVREGENIKYPFWALAYTGMDEKSYYEVLKTGVSDQRYKQLPFTATDSMSFGYTDSGDRSSLYCAVLMRTGQFDDEGNHLWTCSGTYPNAPIRCCTQSVPALLAAQCITIEDALAYVGAVDENYNRIYPNIDPTLDVFTFNIETETMSNHWFEVIAMEDSSGHYGVLEFIENKAIWHDNQRYSFNFFLQDEYLHNPDGTYREQYGAGVGRAQAVVPYLDNINTMEDHLALMDGISYSHMTYYNEQKGYVGYGGNGEPVDWRSEFTGYDVWASYDKYKKLGLDTTTADLKYPIYAKYKNLQTGKIELIDSYKKWQANKDHLKAIYTMNYCLADENKEEIMNFLRWSGCFYSGLNNDQVVATNNAWETYFRVIADPMNFRVTRWFRENITTADTIVWSEFMGTK